MRRSHYDDEEGRGMMEMLSSRLPIGGRAFFFAVLALAVLCASPCLYRRLSVEWSGRTAAMIAEHRDIISLAQGSGRSPEDVWAALSARGVLGICAAELTGKDLAGGMLPISFGPLGSVEPSSRVGLDLPPHWAAMTLDSSDPTLPVLMEYLRGTMPGVIKHVPGKKTLIILPHAYVDLLESAVIPDLAALDFAARAGAAIVYRPVPSAVLDSEGIARAIGWLKGRYPTLATILPAGTVVAGYPDLSPIARKLKELEMTLAQAEFVRQVGISQLLSAMAPKIIPLHSVVRDEVLSRRFSREQLVERMIRAVHERSIKLLLVRPYDLYSSGRLEPFLEDVAAIHDGLAGRGYAISWPRTISRTSSTFMSSLALAMVFLICLGSYLRRSFGSGHAELSRLELAVFIAASLILAAAIRFLPFASRALGGLTAALIAVEASIWALDRYERPSEGLIFGLVIVLCGGLVIAAHYGTSDAMLRLTPFSGVLLTLLLPPVLVLMNDLRLRVHPEPLSSIINRPPMWGELILLGGIGLAAIVVAVRSGNSGYVAGWEIRFRDMLERALWVRPRTKEFLIGYPCLVIYYSLARGGAAAKFREIFRIGACVAFSSAVNTFCHFHTLLPLTLVRVVNGWWLGIVVGFAVLLAADFFLGPFWRRGHPAEEG